MSSEVFVHRPDFGPEALIIWGSSGGRPVVVHLPYKLKPYGASMGAARACRSDLPVCVAWTYSFGFEEWGGRLCKRCFPDGKPADRY